MTTADMRFHGIWIGETQGIDMPAHLWEIEQRGPFIRIATRWEGDERPNPEAFVGRVVANEAAFTMGEFRAILVDPQHFIIPGWCTNDTRGGDGPAFDVVFSRPGIAELTAHSVWLRYTANQATE